MPEAFLELGGVELRYGADLAFAAPSLAFHEGETVALLGPNGCGKTTLLKALNGLISPAAGRILFRGEDTALSAELRRRSVYLHQHPYVLAGTVAYNVSFGCRTRGIGRGEAERRCAKSMALLGLEGFGRRRHRALSGGEAQRVALARALAVGTDILFLDEPTASVDSGSRSLVIDALRALRAGGPCRGGDCRGGDCRGGDSRATIIFSTHDDGLGAELADRVLELELGAVVADRRITR